MSVRAMARVWEMDLPGREKLLLLALADCADDEGGSIYPSIARLVSKTGMSERSVQRIRTDLLRAGLLAVQGTHPSIPQIPRYRIVFKQGAKMAVMAPARVLTKADEGAKPSATLAPNPSDPSLDPSSGIRKRSRAQTEAEIRGFVHGIGNWPRPSGKTT